MKIAVKSTYSIEKTIKTMENEYPAVTELEIIKHSNFSKSNHLSHNINEFWELIVINKELIESIGINVFSAFLYDLIKKVFSKNSESRIEIKYLIIEKENIDTITRDKIEETIKKNEEIDV